ncbi:DUF6713 family protein [Leptospira ryugenii]|uniref:DUF6713 family protein n=1 Tax=Leptospira ryugenii TaxID=1917863 RepID=UPI000D598735|nr:DUF6713 family protein [Leptospira ryugenii]
METIYFATAISFLFIHELDAIQAKEWKLFIVLRDLQERQAYSIWLALHFPLFLLPFLVVTESFGRDTTIFVRIGIDLFLAFHLFLHIYFRKHRDYHFHSIQSNLYIVFTALFASLDLLVLSKS